MSTVKLMEYGLILKVVIFYRMTSRKRATTTRSRFWSGWRFWWCQEDDEAWQAIRSLVHRLNGNLDYETLTEEWVW